MNTDGPSWFALSGAWPPRPLAGDRIQPPNGHLGDVLDAHPRRLSAHRCRMIQRISTQLLDDLRTNVYAVQGSKDSGQLWPGRPSCKAIDVALRGRLLRRSCGPSRRSALTVPQMAIL